MSNIKNIKQIGNLQTYDLEVNHKDHQFYLSNGMLTSNSHSISYSIISYHTAYLKAHYPIEFLLANLMSEINSNAKVAKENIERIKLELRSNGIKIVPPSLNDSDIDYKILPDGSLLTGLKALKFVSEDAIIDIMQKRPFKDFNDFMIKVDTLKVRAPTIQALASSGCFDVYNIPRNLIYLYCSDYRKKLQVWMKKHNPDIETFQYSWPEEKSWTLPEMYALEKSYLGESFVCGKKDAYPGFFKDFSHKVSDIKTLNDRDKIGSMRAEIKNVFEFKVKKETSKLLGEHMVKATIEDEAGEQISLTIFPKQWKEVKARMRDLCGSKYKFEEGICIHFAASVNLYEDQLGLILDNFYTFAPPPSMPRDLKSKKISNKTSSENLLKLMNVSNTQDLISSIEDQLFDEGLIDLNEESD